MLSKIWKIASALYHTNEEYQFIKSMLIEHKDNSIIDCSCGVGFPSINLVRDGFTNLTASDYDRENILILCNSLISLGCKLTALSCAFNELEIYYKDYFDVAFTIGSSLTYCDSWNEEIKEVPSNNQGVSEAIFGLSKCINREGTLIIGNSKLYKKDKANDVIFFPKKQIDGFSYSMEWKLYYNWESCIKKWNCKIYKDSNLYLATNLVSHLFDKEMLVAYCKQYFLSVSIFDAPFSPEYYVICKEKK